MKLLHTKLVARATRSTGFAHTCVRSVHSVVGITTGYGMDGPRIESRWEARFSAPVRTCSEAHPASYTMGTGVKWPGRDVDIPPLSRAKVKERVDLYLYPPPSLGLRSLF